MKTENKILQLWSLTWKDLKLLLFPLSGWLMLIVFDGVIIWLFVQNFFLMGQVELGSFFSFLIWGWLILAAALSGHSFSQEKENKTLELLLSFPLESWQLVVAKFLAGMIVFGVIFFSFIPLFGIIYHLGQFDLGQFFSAWLGNFLLFSFFFSYTIFTSLFFSNLVVVFLFNLFSLFVFYLLGSEVILSRVPAFFSQVMGAFSLNQAWRSFLIGVPSLWALTFFVSGIVLFLSLAIIKLKKIQPR